MSTTTQINKTFTLEVGSRLGNKNAPCVWLLYAETGVEFARADRSWISGKLEYHYSGGVMRTDEVFADIVEGLASLRTEANKLPMYGVKAGK